MHKKRKKIFVTFMGMDGSGKTTQAMNLAKTMRNYGIMVKYIWIGWVPTILKPVTELGKLFLNKRMNVNTTDYREFTAAKKNLFKNHFLAVMWMYYVVFDYALQIFIKISIPLLFGRSIICDRYIYDILINLCTRYGLPEYDVFRILKNRIMALFPKPTFIFFLDVPEKVAFERKGDIPTLGYLIEHRKLYLKLADILGIMRIESSGDPEKIHHRITEKVVEYLTK